MKSKLMIFLLPILIMGCEPTNPTNPKEFENTGILFPKTVVIDSCEYIEYRGYYSIYITHKGNCNNPLHKKFKN